MAPQERPVEPGAVRLDAPGRAEQLVGRVKQREDAGLSGHPRENRGGPPLRHSADYTQFPHQRTAGHVGERSGGGTCEFYLVRTVQPAHQVPKRRDIRARRRRQEAIEFPRCHHRGWPGPGAAMIVDRVSDRRTTRIAAEQGQSFVNQLQMALFAWVKKHPAGDRPLGGLFVMDEAQTLAPSGAMTACTRSTLALASQARKYGLGLVFATQSPKGLHNHIPGNAATQCYGLLNAPVQIDAAREMAHAKGGDVAGISQLRTGEFYLAVEGQPFVRVRTPMCLSHHPKSPLTTEEVIDRARAG